MSHEGTTFKFYENYGLIPKYGKASVVGKISNLSS